MDKNLQHIDDLFRGALENDEEQLSPGVWNNIEHVLDKDGLIFLKKRYNSFKKIVIV